MDRDNRPIYIGSGLIGSVWLLATFILICNWWIKDIPSWIVGVCNAIFIIGVAIPVIAVVGFLLVVILAVVVDNWRH